MPQGLACDRLGFETAAGASSSMTLVSKAAHLQSAGSMIASAFKDGIVAMAPDWLEPGVGQGSGVRETVGNAQVLENRSEGPPIMRERCRACFPGIVGPRPGRSTERPLMLSAPFGAGCPDRSEQGRTSLCLLVDHALKIRFFEVRKARREASLFSLIRGRIGILRIGLLVFAAKNVRTCADRCRSYAWTAPCRCRPCGAKKRKTSSVALFESERIAALTIEGAACRKADAFVAVLLLTILYYSLN